MIVTFFRYLAQILIPIANKTGICYNNDNRFLNLYMQNI